MLLEKFTLPSYWASALINGDESGLEDSEIAEIDSFINWLLQSYDCAFCVDCSEESFFTRYHDAPNNLASDCLEYTFDLGKMRESFDN